MNLLHHHVLLQRCEVALIVPTLPFWDPYRGVQGKYRTQYLESPCKKTTWTCKYLCGASELLCALPNPNTSTTHCSIHAVRPRPRIPESPYLNAEINSAACARSSSHLVHGWDSIKNLHVYSLLGVSNHKYVKCYPTMTKSPFLLKLDLTLPSPNPKS